MDTPLHVIAAVVDTQQLTLYLKDGSTEVIHQGDSRIRPLVDKVIPALENQGYCLLDRQDLSVASHYSTVEDRTQGFVQFFRTFKATMENLFTEFATLAEAPAPSTDPVAPVKAGQLPSAVAEVMANAVPSSHSAFHTPLNENETVVAVVGGHTVVPGVEKLDLQLQGVASNLGSPEGVSNFFLRLASVERNHSIQDLLTFMEKGELPLADDGSVLVYKRLNSTHEPDVFVDCHTGKVKQRVGSHVFMDEKLVDPDRHQECSNGLHVARRDYLHSFNGNVTVLAKLAPEDVIAVPHRDARKLRAKGYHIVAQLSAEDARLVCGNHPMKDAVLLGNVIRGNHVGVLETVEIHGQQGEDVVITPVSQAVPTVKLQQNLQGKSLDTLPEAKAEDAQVDAAQLAKNLAKANSPRSRIRQLLDQGPLTKARAKDILAIKKAAKKAWDKLGVTPSELDRILKLTE